MKGFSGVPDYERAEESLKRFNVAYNESGMEGIFSEYAALSAFFQALIISDNGYVVDAGNFQTVNKEILENILNNVKKHPKLWKLFMVC